MRCPTLSELPPSPPGKTGWPWTEESPQLPAMMPDGRPWPRVSTVTPSYNQGQFIEETIRSVLLQGYPDLEYFIIDGGSTDGSAEIIRRYERWLTYWVSEPDRGQSHAINKGLLRATGEYCNYINSDDLLVPNTLFEIARVFQAYPNTHVIYGKCVLVDEKGQTIAIRQGQILGLLQLLRVWEYMGSEEQVSQPAVFCRRDILVEVNGFREDLHYTMDYEMWLRLLDRGYRFQLTDVCLAKSRIHRAQKSAADRGFEEIFPVVQELLNCTAKIEEKDRRELVRAIPRERAYLRLWVAHGAYHRSTYWEYTKWCFAAVKLYPPVVGSWLFWAIVTIPLKPWIPGKVRAWLKWFGRRAAAHNCGRLRHR